MSISIEQVKELREATGAGVLDCRKTLEQVDGDMKKAIEILREKGLAKAAKREERETSEGVLDLYSHGNGRIGVMVEVNCETDFVARSTEFRNLAHEIALQVAAAAPLFIQPDDIPVDTLQQERETARKLGLEEGKPENIIDRIVEGRLEKFKDERCLLRQTYIRDDSITIQDLINQYIASMGEKIVVRRFIRWEVGDTA
jgi:elongation factor Ts